MLYLDLALASILSAQPADTAPVPAPAPAEPTSATAPAPAPAPAEPTSATAPAPAPAEPTSTTAPIPIQPAPIPIQPAPIPVQPAPTAVQPAPVSDSEQAPGARTYSGPVPSSTEGLGMLVTGPLLVLAAVPMSLVGNASWRNNCGPDSSSGQCASGSVGSFIMHAFAASSYGLGITFTGLGARKHAPYSVYSGRAPDGVPLIVTGSTLLPLGLLGMSMARVFLWIGTPDCVRYSCVQYSQTTSTLTVGAGAVVAATGAGLLMYGIRVKKAQKHHEFSLAPHLGRDQAGLGLTGRF